MPVAITTGLSHESVMDIVAASLIMKLKREGKVSAGHAVAISNKRALTALHGLVALKTSIEFRTKTGVALTGTVEYVKFEEELVDIAVVVLDDNLYFEKFLPWRTPKVTITQPILCFGLKNGGDSTAPFALTANVNLIENETDSALFQSTYYSYDGCSGAGIVTTLKNNILSVVGVHIA